jgi:hypothetical protein
VKFTVEGRIETSVEARAIKALGMDQYTVIRARLVQLTVADRREKSFEARAIKKLEMDQYRVMRPIFPTYRGRS